MEKKINNLKQQITLHKQLIEECKTQASFKGVDVLPIGIFTGFGDGYASPIKVKNFIKFLECEIIKSTKEIKELEKIIKPLDLVEFLKENLVPKEFEYESDNYTLLYDYSTKALYINIDIQTESTFPYFNSISFEVLGTLNDNKITLKQLKQAYKKLNWI